MRRRRTSRSRPGAAPRGGAMPGAAPALSGVLLLMINKLFPMIILYKVDFASLFTHHAEMLSNLLFASLTSWL